MDSVWLGAELTLSGQQGFGFIVDGNRAEMGKDSEFGR